MVFKPLNEVLEFCFLIGDGEIDDLNMVGFNFLELYDFISSVILLVIMFIMLT